MNPIGVLQELSTSYKWVPPMYSCVKTNLLNEGQLQCGDNRRESYEVTCQMFNLETTGMQITFNKIDTKII